MKLFPLINNFRATSYLKAFILNALIGGIITALAIELRLQLEDNSSKYYKFWMNVYNVKSLHIKHKLITTFISTSIVALLIYILFWILVPEALTTADKLTMTGEPVNISNIEKKIKDGFDSVSETVTDVAKNVSDSVSGAAKNVSMLQKK